MFLAFFGTGGNLAPPPCLAPEVTWLEAVAPPSGWMGWGLGGWDGVGWDGMGGMGMGWGCLEISVDFPRNFLEISWKFPEI